MERRNTGDMLGRLAFSQLLFLLVSQLLILLPLRRFFLGIELLGTRIAFAHRASLGRCQLDPFAHAFLQARLLFGCHAGKFVADDQPFFLAARLQFVPFAGQRCQGMLLRWGQFIPAWFAFRLFCRCFGRACRTRHCCRALGPASCVEQRCQHGQRGNA